MIIAYKDFAKTLNQVGHCYVLEGDEHLLKLEAVALLKKKLGDNRVFFREYWASEQSNNTMTNTPVTDNNSNATSQMQEKKKANHMLDALWSDVYSQPLFEDRNLIILWEANNKLLQALVKQWTEYLDHPASVTTLVIESSKGGKTKDKKADASGKDNESEDTDEENKARSSTKGQAKKGSSKQPSLQTLLTNLLKRDDVIRVNCEGMKPYETKKWVVERAKQYQKKISMEAADLLVEMTGTGLQSLDQQLQQLADFIKDRANIEVNDIETLIKATRKMDVFAFLNSIFDSNQSEAITMLHFMFQRGMQDMKGKLMHKESDVARQLIGLLKFQLEKLWIAVVTKKFGNMHPYMRQLLEKQAAHFTPTILASLWQKLFDVDLATKTTATDGKCRQAIEEFMFLVWELRRS